MTAPLSRRGFLAAAGSAAFAGSLPAQAPPARKLPRLAAVNTIYRMRSHSYHIVGRFIHGYTVGGFDHQPPFEVVRMYNDQYPQDDLSIALARKKGFGISRTVADALGGEAGLDVDGVLLIGEHGEYPINDIGQKLYPRHKLFMEIVEHFKKSGRTCPVFNDKHLSYDHAQARQMYDLSRQMKFPLMAGSSLPVTWRLPELSPPIGTPITEALVVHDGGAEVYGFHALETLQTMMERRSPREAGVKSIRALKGPAVWKAGDDGLWSWDLFRACLGRSRSRNIGDVRDNVTTPVVILVEYNDGSRGACLNAYEHVADFTFAAKVKGRPDPISTLFYLPNPPGARYFDALTWSIEKFLQAGAPPYPVERTLLTSITLDMAMRSLAAGGKPMAFPGEAVTYAPVADDGHFRGRIADAG